MSKFHTTVSRRTFMKGLGLTGIGLGAAAAASPVFHDLDEVTASPQAGWHRPWYIKSRDIDDTTVPIEWSNMQRRDKTKTDPYGGGSLYGFVVNRSTHPEAVAVRARGTDTKSFKDAINDEWIRARFPDWTTDSVRNLAVASGAGSLRFYNFAGNAGKTSFMGIEKAKTPEQLGMPKWSGTPEESLLTLRAGLRYYGAQDAAITELTTNVKKLVCAKGGSGRQWVLDSSVDQPEETDTQYIIPSRFRYIITYTIMQSDELTKRAPSQLGKSATSMAYTHWPRIKVNLQEFIRGLGYTGLDMGSDIPSNALGILSGVGEHARMGNIVISPEYGGQLRGIGRILTDLPLAPTNPIDAGIYKFCFTCKICAEGCPTDALPMDDPVWDVDPMWNPRVLDVPYAHEGWHQNPYRCINCAACMGLCPFNSTKESPIHEIVFATLATTSIFDKFLANMERTFRYGFQDPDTWWDLDLPVFGVSAKFMEKSI